ncbi:MAG TPA: acyltransferase [Candidatus Limnocylindrales bacterium]|nr:acyltransferase [Candidatus Limnocylindrales bacterium]
MIGRRDAARVLGWLTTLPYRRPGRRVALGPGLLGNGRLRISGPGRVELGGDVNAWSHAEVNRLVTTRKEAVIRIGARTRMNGCTLIAAGRIEVGADCVLGSCEVRDHDDVSVQGAADGDFAPPKPTIIEDGAWIGGQVVIAPGVRIGRNAVIGIHAAVFEDVPPDVIAAGNPARVLRRLDADPDSDRAERG